MANKKINQLDARVGVSLTDLVLIGDPTTGTSYKLTATELKTLLDFVPYVGATANLLLGEFGIFAGYFQADLTPTGTQSVGRLIWNDTDGTLDLGLKGGNVTLQIGQEQVQRVVNKSGVNLLESAYQVVKVTNAQGQRLAVDLAQANNDANSTDTLGIVTETISVNQEGFICTSGLIRGINTTGSLQGETWIDGDVIYLSPTIPGAITKVKPDAPNHSVILGYVVYAHINNGKIFVKCDNGYELGELHNIYVPTPSNNDGIFWNTANSRYQNNSISGVLGYTPLSGSGVTGRVAYWNGTNSQTGSNNLFWDAANSRLGIGTNAPADSLQVVGGNLLIDNNRAYRAKNSVGSSLDILKYDTSNSLLLGSIFAGGQFISYTSTSFRWFQYPSSVLTERMQLTSAGNFILQNGGAFSDAGQRLQVYGDAFIKGSGNSSATVGLTVQNSDGISVFRARNEGRIFLGSSSTSIFPMDKSTTSISLSGNGLSFFDTSATSGNTFYFTGSDYTHTSGAAILLNATRLFWPTSGTGTLIMSNISPNINQTGGANGITRGLYINPTLTAAADWRSIEWSNNSGWGLYGAGTANNYIAGALGIGTTSALSFVNVNLARRIGGAATAWSVYNQGTIQSDVTNTAFYFSTEAITQAAAFTVGNIFHYNAQQSAIGLGSTVTNQFGYAVNSTLIGATNNYGFYGNIPNGTNRWNLYMSGTADNYLAGKLLINTTTVGTYNLDVNGTARVSGLLSLNLTNTAGNRIMFFDGGTTSTRIGISYNVGIAFHSAFDAPFKFAFDVDGSNYASPVFTIGRTNITPTIPISYTTGVGNRLISFDGNSSGFRSGIGTGSVSQGGLALFTYPTFDMFFGTGQDGSTLNSSNSIMWISAANSSLNIGATSNQASAILQASSTTKGFLPPRGTNAQMLAIASPVAGLMFYDTTNNKLNCYDGTTWQACW